MTLAEELSSFRNRFHESYASQHVGRTGEAAALVYRRDIRSLLLAREAEPVIDLGYGRGDFVRLLKADDFDAEGIDISPEQVAVARAVGVSQVRQGICHGGRVARRGGLVECSPNSFMAAAESPSTCRPRCLRAAAGRKCGC